MEISIREIKSYMYCPYYLRFNKNNIPLLKVKAKDHYYNCLKFVISDFMKEWFRNGKPPELSLLESLWNKTWFEDPMALIYPDGENHTHMGNSGWMVLRNFYTNFTSKPICIEAIDKPYKINTLLSNDKLTGSIDILIRQGPQYSAIQLVDTDYNASHTVGSNNIEMTAIRRAIKTMMNEDNEPALGYYILAANTKDIVYTRRNNDQNGVLDETVRSVAKAIEQDLYYPNFGRRCNGCDYLNICDKARWVQSTKLLKYGVK